MSTFITYEGDNLAIMRELPSETIDLIYIDPPYFSQRNYGDFDDRWKSMQHYLDFMVERLKEMHRVLKSSGSIYVHLDWHAVHYIKIEMDKVFGYSNFKNSISWCYTAPSNSKSYFPRKHDEILFYSKSDNYNFNADSIRIPYSKETIARAGRNGSSVDGSIFNKTTFNPLGKIPEDWWIDIVPTSRRPNHGVMYKTQKPSKLMERIILASSNQDDLVADFFCGSGSFIKKAHELGRSCIGVDVSPKALVLARSPTKREPDLKLESGKLSGFE